MIMNITATHINYYFICRRKLWLFANGISMEHESELVYEGKLIHEYSYQQRAQKYQEIVIQGSVIDYYDPKNKIIHEVKKSDKREEAHVWQLRYYIYLLKQSGIDGVRGILDYPALRKKEEVVLTGSDEEKLHEIVQDIGQIIRSDKCPGRLAKSKCRNCSYYDFCWAEEGIDTQSNENI